jgi:imidazoleglycerol-phosphate dehydratase
VTANRRIAEIQRATRETEIRLTLDLDGSGRAQAATGVGFLDHMLELLTKHALFDLTLEARGDRHVDDHHTTEDVGIVLGQALDQALGDKAGIRRYGHCVLPMDEALVTTAVDLSGRAYLGWSVILHSPLIGTFASEVIEEFWRGVAFQARMNLHVIQHSGTNTHHVSEAIFKGVARALRMACESDPRVDGIPSTKGSL